MGRVEYLGPFLVRMNTVNASPMADHDAVITPHPMRGTRFCRNGCPLQQALMDKVGVRDVNPPALHDNPVILTVVYGRLSQQNNLIPGGCLNGSPSGHKLDLLQFVVLHNVLL